MDVFNFGKSMKIFMHFLASLCLSLTLTLPSYAVDHFPTESKAQQHCPSDIVVWLNLPSMIWHSKGTRWYGVTKSGAYVCRAEAAAEGARGSRNGQ